MITKLNTPINNLDKLLKIKYIGLTKGFKINGIGRLNSFSRSPRTRKTIFKIGATKTSSINTLIDYNFDTQITRNGIYSLKVLKFYTIFNIKKYLLNKTIKYLN